MFFYYLQKIEGPGIVTGGPPALLASGKVEPQQAVDPADAAMEAVNGQRVPTAITLKSYTWCDSKGTVK